MTLNRDQADHERQQIHDDATQAEIASILASDGPQYCGTIANKLGLHPQEVRWHLTEMQSRFEVEYNWITRKYSL